LWPFEFAVPPLLTASLACDVYQVLDEFHDFAERGKQTLLYNLCDLLQSDRAQIALIGITTRLDVDDYLEKRVKSRMSYRRILFGHCDQFATLKRILTNALIVPCATTTSAAVVAPSESKNDTNANSFYRDARPAIPALPANATYIERYNHSVLTVLDDGMSDDLTYSASALVWCLR
jgi:Cdc6-like AAA superfamily ATPase